jgi:hypothetical protein
MEGWWDKLAGNQWGSCYVYLLNLIFNNMDFFKKQNAHIS